MLYNILAIGDVVAESGLEHLKAKLADFKKEKNIAFTVVNGENTSGVGLTPAQAEAIFEAGADVITLGNHTFNQPVITDMLNNCERLLRPANYTYRAPGHGIGVFECGDVTIAVINLIGRQNLDYNSDNPFFVVEKLMDENKATFTVVDFHADFTGERKSMGYFLNGKASAVWGTHTHIPTADLQILDGGTGYISDLGITGPEMSVLGIAPEQMIESFLGGRPGRFRAADGPCFMQGAIFTLDSDTGKCVAVEQICVR